MNFLAHALLAGDEPSLIVGGVVGDWIKGPLPGQLPADLARGVALHRAIDSHAETHPAFSRSRNRVSPPRRRYAGVFVDIYYDHLLARDWANHHDAPLANYCADVYAHLATRLPDLPATARPTLALMADEDWLGSYADIDSIAGVLRRMARRARQPNPLAGGEADFLADPAGFADDFHAWLGDARQRATAWCNAAVTATPSF
jgi:acyl carrier protein phosphodiesterase